MHDATRTFAQTNIFEMITRLVKLTFAEQHVPTFIQIFESSKNLIRAFEGCEHVELLNDVENPNIFFTRSIWCDETALNLYRDSELFKTTWTKTKVLFAAKPEAWTTKLLNIAE